MEEIFETRIDLKELQSNIELIKTELGKVIVGQEQMVNQLLTAVLANGHVLIEGVPGIAKTLTAKLLAKTISVDFMRLQFTPDMMPSDVIGTQIYNQKISDFEFKKGPIFSNIVLIDEINRAPAKTQSALFEVMEERQITSAGITHPMTLPYIVFATQNPIEQEGTYRLPEAQLDRFLYKILVSYPESSDERIILQRHHEQTNAQLVATVQAVLSKKNLLKAQQTIRTILVEENILNYITALTITTRNFAGIYLGASPRASISILNAAKALAAINGRDFVTPEDVQEVAYPALRHRILLTPEKEMEGGTADDVVKQIIEQVEVPR